MTPRVLLLGLSASAVLACAAATEPVAAFRAPAGSFFTPNPNDPAVSGWANPPTIRVDPTRIIVRSSIPAPSWCFVMRASAVVEVDAVTISIAADSTNVFGCAPFRGSMYYRVITDLPARTYQLRVRHTIVGFSDEWVTDTAIIVP